jgi:LPS export ABC transporter protein LptC
MVKLLNGQMVWIEWRLKGFNNFTEMRAAIIFSAFLLPAILFSSCENDMKMVEKITSPSEALTESGKNVEALYSDNGHVKARLTAPTVKRVNDKAPYTELPDGMLVIFYGDSSTEQSRLTARYGISYDNTYKMEARDSVHVVNNKGESLNTEDLVWDQRLHQILSDQFVKITTKDEIIMGDGFQSNEDLSDHTIRKIRGTIKLNPASDSTARKE